MTGSHGQLINQSLPVLSSFFIGFFPVFFIAEFQLLGVVHFFVGS